jgi:mannose-6-phosphate isomerase-like protein (cupin superfamily)
MPVVIDIDKAPTLDLPNGRGKIILLFNPKNYTKNVDVHINILNPGVKKGDIHYHKNIENVYIVLEGKGKNVDENGKEYKIKAGQAIFMKPGEPPDTHGILNTGKVPLRLVEVYAPPQPREAYDGDSFDASKRDHITVKNID